MSVSYPQPAPPQLQPQALQWTPPEGDPIPFSEWGGSAATFVQRLNYGGQGASEREQRRGLGDHKFLGGVQDALGPYRSVSSITESELEDVVDQVERELWSARWRLSGDEDMPLLQRVDLHFQKPQRQWVEAQKQQAREREVRDRQAKERELNELRGHIGLTRQRIAEEEAMVEAMESDLAALAEKLGVPAWPQ